MKPLYLDIFSGISGDIFLGALIDLGVDPAGLKRELKKLPLEGYEVWIGPGRKSQIKGTKFDVHLDHDGHEHGHDHAHAHKSGHHHEHEEGRTHAEIKKLILDSDLSAWVKEKSVKVFERIAVAEGKIHGVPPGKVHFHDVGAVDSIVDIVGGCIAVEMLGKPRVLAPPVSEGTGWIYCAHPPLPPPPPPP